jgi:hypothetical protein
MFSADFIKEPTAYEEALNCELKEEQIKGKDEINIDLKEMTKRGLWEGIDEKEISINCQCTKNKWIFKVKRYGIFRARLVSCG